MEFLEQQPVADDVFDVVRHHRQHRADEKNAEARMVQRRKGDLLFRLCLCRCLSG